MANITKENAAEMARKRWEKARALAAEGAEEAIRQLVYSGGDEPCDADTLDKRVALYRPPASEAQNPPDWWWSIIIGARAVVAATDPSHAGNTATEIVGKATGLLQAGHSQQVQAEGASLHISEGALDRLQGILSVLNPQVQTEVIDVTPIEIDDGHDNNNYHNHEPDLDVDKIPF